MAETVGGLWITEYKFTRSFGIAPASASGTAVLGAGESSTGLQVGDYVVYTFAGIVFYGILSAVEENADRETGRVFTFSIVDNRVRLAWQLCFGQWNLSQDPDEAHDRSLPRPPPGEFSAGAASGSDGADFDEGVGVPAPIPGSALTDPSLTRGRVYAHRVGSQWASQMKTYTDDPVSAADILRSAMKSAVGSFGYILNFHPDQDNPVFDVDANSGMTMASLIQQIAEAQGLQVTLDGSRTLRFERRGEGTLVIPPPPVHLQLDGEAMSADPTKIRIVGDRTLVQVNNITLEPDWRRGWEVFISEPAWLAEVDRVFGPFEPSDAGRAECAARAREVTLGAYLASESDKMSDLADHRRWGRVSRMNMPVWAYLNSILFRSYRVPDGKMLYGMQMKSLEIHESLLCAVQLDGTGGGAEIKYRNDPEEYYPQDGAFVIAKGQPLDLLNAADRGSLVKLRQTDMREEWSEMADFTVDVLNHSVRFGTPVFIDGDPSENKSILLFPNKGEGGYRDLSADAGEGSDYLSLVVPNADYEIEPAEVKVSLVFRLGKYYRDFGTGVRWTTANVPNIAEHLLDSAGSYSGSKVAAYAGDLHVPSPPSGLKEILYDDGLSADEQAEAQADGLIRKSGLERSGSYVRHGVAGTVLTGVIDRVTIEIKLGSGISETVEFCKPRSTSGFVAMREIGQRTRTEDLFAGQTELRREARQLRGIALLDRLGINDKQRSDSHSNITDVLRQPIGGDKSGVTTYGDPNEQWPESQGAWRAGNLVWLDEQGLPSRSGFSFGGVVVSKPPSGAKYVVCATSGTVPVYVTPGSSPGASLSADAGDWKCGSGNVHIGTLGHSKVAPGEGDDPVVALVRLGDNGDGLSFKPVFSSGGVMSITPGTVGVGFEGNRRIQPYYPKWEGKRLNAVPAPSKDLSELEAGEYKAIVRFCNLDGRIEISPKDEDVGSGGTETTNVPSGSDSGGREWIIDLFYFEITEDRRITKVDHRQKDGIIICCGSSDCSSGSDEDESDSGDSDDSDDSDDSNDSDDSGNSDDDSNDFSDSDDSSNDSDSGGEGGECCPTISDFNAYVVSVGDGDYCFESGAGLVQTVNIAVTGYVGTIQCKECAGRLWVEYGVAGLDGVKKASSYLGFGGGQEFGQTFDIQGSACSEVQAFARVRRFGVPIPESPGAHVCEQLEGCEESIDVKLPGYCSNDGECDTTGVPSGSDSPSDDSGGSGDPPGSSDGDSSEDDSGSGDTTDVPSGSDSKECVVPLSSSPTGKAALRCVESPETWFLDIRTITLVVTGRISMHSIDSDFVEVCVPGSILVQSIVPDKAVPVGAVVEGCGIELRVSCWPWARPRRVAVTVAGIRAGCEGERFVPRTTEQYDRSRRFWSKLTL